jgi:RimJ/RimL family protein N-acetyltransferase
MRDPVRLETERLLLRQPRMNDVQAIFERYASDPQVTRYLGWPLHTAQAHTRAFVEFSNAQWKKWNIGPLLAISREDGNLLGSAGLSMETPERAQTGYVFARDAWGKGYATESLQAMMQLAARLGLTSLYALCHPEHRASSHVLEKCGFTRDGIVPAGAVFPNLSPDPADVVSYSKGIVPTR